MTYLIDLPYEIHTCQECPFKRTDRCSTKCIFARDGEKLSIRGGTCPIQWNTGEPTEEGWYLLKLDYEGEIRYAANEWCWILGWQWKYAMLGEVIAWQRIDEYKGG